jgi:hypothetical protein
MYYTVPKISTDDSCVAISRHVSDTRLVDQELIIYPPLQAAASIFVV